MSGQSRSRAILALPGRLGLVGLVAGGLTLAGSPAAALDTATVALSPPEVEVVLLPVENFGSGLGYVVGDAVAVLHAAGDFVAASAWSGAGPGQGRAVPADPATAAAVPGDAVTGPADGAAVAAGSDAVPAGGDGAAETIGEPNLPAVRTETAGVAAEHLAAALEVAELDPAVAETLGTALSEVPAAEADIDFETVALEWGGTAGLVLPGTFDTSTMDVHLELYSGWDAEHPDRVYSTAATGADQLSLTDLGGGVHGVTLPSDTGDGPLGLLTFDSLLADDPAVNAGSVDYVVEFTGTGALDQTFQPQMFAFGSVPCALSSPEPCPAAEVTAGADLALTLPADSALRSVGITGVEPLDLQLMPFDESTGGEEDGYWLTEDPAAVSYAGADRATTTLPADLPGGTYLGWASLGDLEVGPSAHVVFEIDVTARAVPEIDVAVPEIDVTADRGLRSETGWVEPAADDPGLSVALVAAGTGLVALAGAALVRLRSARRPADES